MWSVLETNALPFVLRSYIHHNINTVLSSSSLPSVAPSIARVLRVEYGSLGKGTRRPYCSNSSSSSSSLIIRRASAAAGGIVPISSFSSRSSVIVSRRFLRTAVMTYQQASSSATVSASTISDTNTNNNVPLEDIILTPRAVHRIQFLQNKANNSITNNTSSNGSSISPATPTRTLYLRVKVDGGGCSGFKYDFTIEYNDQPNKEEDRIFTRDNSNVIIDNVSLDLLRGSVIDYEEGLLKASFVIASNPNAESSCGCKASFAVKEK